jgi:FlaA1/EpsC-like NDP-sugar epimerase
MIDLRDVTVQERLLGRRVREVLTAEERRAFNGQRVMITGAGGTIGSELARQIAVCRPERLTLFEQSEYDLFRIEEELRETHPDLALDPVLGDVRRARSVFGAFRTARPHVVFHAAAYKHVTMNERAVCAAVEANVLGTVMVASAARDLGARMVLVSSDKAVRPASVMGATKRMAELAVLLHASPFFRPVVVRFGNVLGSRGSVAEILVDRLRRGLPFKITDPAATRYLMTAQEAVALVMKADLVGQGGEIYWLDMGGPVRLSTLVDRVMELGRREERLKRVPVQIVGLRPGEKLHEELTHDQDLSPSGYDRLWVTHEAAFQAAVVRRVLRALRQDVADDDAAAALSDLCAAIPGFRPSDRAWADAAATTVSTSPLAMPSGSVVTIHHDGAPGIIS